MIILALGSNLGDRLAHITRAHTALGLIGRITGTSAIYETAPQYVTDQPDFLNAAVTFETNLEPVPLLLELKRLEKVLGRTPTVRCGPRVIDIDIIYYHDQVMTSEALMLPHPARQERSFVLKPVHDVAPDFIDPITKESIAVMLTKLGDLQGLRIHGTQSS